MTWNREIVAVETTGGSTAVAWDGDQARRIQSLGIADEGVEDGVQLLLREAPDHSRAVSSFAVLGTNCGVSPSPAPEAEDRRWYVCRRTPATSAARVSRSGPSLGRHRRSELHALELRGAWGWSMARVWMGASGDPNLRVEWAGRDERGPF